MRRIISISVAAAIMLSAALLTGCSIISMTTGVRYDNASEYTAGDGEVDGFDKLELEWVSGSVSIVAYGGDKVTITESTNKEIKDDLKVHWWLDGDTLHIEFCASGSGWNFNGIEKKLTVSVPENLEISKMKLDTVSADVSVTGLTVGELSGDSVSGNVRLDTVSDKIDLDSVSGDLTVAVKDGVRKCGINTVSGKVVLDVTDSTGVSLSFDTISGRIKESVELTIRDDRYIFGDGQTEIDVDTVSGDVKIERNEK